MEESLGPVTVFVKVFSLVVLNRRFYVSCMLTILSAPVMVAARLRSCVIKAPVRDAFWALVFRIRRV